MDWRNLIILTSFKQLESAPVMFPANPTFTVLSPNKLLYILDICESLKNSYFGIHNSEITLYIFVL